MTINRNHYRKGRLTAMPASILAKEKASAGVVPLKLGGSRDGYIYVPKNYNPTQAASLAVMLHGAGGTAAHGLDLLREHADNHNVLLLAPASRAQSWDIIASEAFDLDVIFIDQALTQCFQQFNIDPERIAIGGFSDGASYALCLGLSNGDLFTHIMAFSPGFAFTLERKGNPAIFISHGVEDQVLPIDACSRRLIPNLRSQGYSLNYQEFSGGHIVPAAVSQDAVKWFLA